MRFTIDQKQCKKINKSYLNVFRPSQESKRSFHYDGYTSRLQRLKQVRHLPSSSQNKSSSSRCLPNTFIEPQSSRIQRLKFVTNLQCRLEKKPRPVSHPLIGNILTENTLTPIIRSYDERNSFHNVVHHHIKYKDTNENDKQRIQDQNRTIDLSKIENLDKYCLDRKPHHKKHHHKHHDKHHGKHHDKHHDKHHHKKHHHDKEHHDKKM